MHYFGIIYEYHFSLRNETDYGIVESIVVLINRKND